MDIATQMIQSLHALCELVASELQFAPLAILVGIVSIVGTAVAWTRFLHPKSKSGQGLPSLPPRQLSVDGAMNALKLAWNVLAIAGAWLLSPVGMSLLIVVVALTLIEVLRS